MAGAPGILILNILWQTWGREHEGRGYVSKVKCSYLGRS